MTPHQPRLDTLGLSTVLSRLLLDLIITGDQNTADRNEPTVNIGILDACVALLPTTTHGRPGLLEFARISSAPLISSPPFSSVSSSHSQHTTHYTFLPFRVNLHILLNSSSFLLILLEHFSF